MPGLARRDGELYALFTKPSHELVHAGEGAAFCPADGRVAFAVQLDRPVRLLGAHAVAQREHLVQRRAGKAHEIL